MKCCIYIFVVCVIASVHEGDAGSSARKAAFRRGSPDTPESRPVSRKDSGFEDEDSLNDWNVYEREANADSATTNEEMKLKRLLEDKDTKKVLDETLKRFASEMAAADPAALTGSAHIRQAKKYNHLGRRFIPQYKYTEKFSNGSEPEDTEFIPIKVPSKNPEFENAEPIPEKAPPELVLVVAKESALMADKYTDNDVNHKKALRTGDYWNGFWKEDVDPAKITLRTGKEKVLGSIKARIMPGTDFYEVITRMKKISPRLLYIINKN